MKLRDLFSDDATIDPQAKAVEISGLAVDSRAVKPGDLSLLVLLGHKMLESLKIIAVQDRTGS